MLKFLPLSHAQGSRQETGRIRVRIGVKRLG
jgi:hypothetical protein